MKERLQKILASRGLCSRRKAEEIITAGRVTVNGSVANLGDSADMDLDTILVDGKPLPSLDTYVYILLHKPKGYLSAVSDARGRRCVSELVADCGQRVYPVGRLDYDSEGLLLMTNDGAFANHLMHPSHEVNKVYRVQVTGFTEEGLRKLREPVTLDGYTIKKPGIKLVKADGNRAKLLVTIHEGRYRQVRRMCALAGMEVTRLVRIQEGDLAMGDLPRGTWRYLTDPEVAALKK